MSKEHLFCEFETSQQANPEAWLKNRYKCYVV